MRRQSFTWTFLVLAIVLTGYGGFSIIYSRSQNKNVPVLGWIFFIVGIVLLALFLVLLLISFIQKKKEKPPIEAVSEPKLEPVEEEIKPEPQPVKEEENEKEETITRASSRDYDYEYSRKPQRERGGSGYVKKIGYGPVLRINDTEVLDMRSNTYYRIEGNTVMESGRGPVFEINGRSIKLTFGGYLFEISGSNVNKTFGGFYASINSGFLKTHDLSEEYELPSDLTLKQQLVVVALLFRGN